MKTRPTPLLALLLVCIVCTACGKKGPPLAPLRRVPAAATALSADRFAEDVFVRFTVPSANVEGPGPADLARVEVYAITAARPLAADELRDEGTRKLALLVASEGVRRPLPPPPPSEPGRPAPPPPPVEAGLDQGATATVRETLSAAARTPVDLSALGPGTAGPLETSVPAGPLVAPDGVSGPRRYYFAVGVTRGGRYGAPSQPVGVPLDQAGSAPRDLKLGYDEQSVLVRWAAPPDAWLAHQETPEAGTLAARPIVVPPPPTRYDVYEVAKRTDSALAPLATAPQPLNAEPLTVTELRVPGVRFGVERCFAVRPVDTRAGAALRGSLSAPACVTPADTFPPAAPRNLEAVAGAGAISLIWEANTERDLAGYVVLRGEAPGERLTPLTPAPIRDTRFDDASAKPGVRYAYAVVAVDGASPQNVSAQSNRVEETTRE